MTPEQFQTLMAPVFAAVAGQTVERGLGARLDAVLPSDGPAVKAIEAACYQAIAAGWMCSQGEGGRRFGRVIKPQPETHDLSVDVVDLTDVVGPHHKHPNGEICLVMPVDATAQFDNHGRGWCVFRPGSAHRPTVTGGRALVLYLLPGGLIEFTGAY